jgi:hypothetical protein
MIQKPIAKSESLMRTVQSRGVWTGLSDVGPCPDTGYRLIALRTTRFPVPLDVVRSAGDDAMSGEVGRRQTVESQKVGVVQYTGRIPRR